MTERFNTDLWVSQCRDAIARRDGDRLASLAYQCDQNGCFGYSQTVHEFGPMSRGEWLDALIETVSGMIADAQ